MRKTSTTPQPPESPVLPGVKKLLKVEEVADNLGGSLVKVYLLLRSGLPSVKIDGARRFQPDKLQDWIEQHRS
jgi:hypothetical protein